MTKQEYLAFHAETCRRMVEITKAKNADYTGTNTDPFANFSIVEKLGIASVEQGFLVRMMDKVSRINSFVQKGVLEVKDESVEDTLIDLANYSIILAAYIRSRRTANNPRNPGRTASAGTSAPQLGLFDFSDISGATAGNDAQRANPPLQVIPTSTTNRTEA